MNETINPEEKGIFGVIENEVYIGNAELKLENGHRIFLKNLKMSSMREYIDIHKDIPNKIDRREYFANSEYKIFGDVEDVVIQRSSINKKLQ